MISYDLLVFTYQLKEGFRTIVFIFNVIIVISITFQSICPPAFFRGLSNSGAFTELRTTSFIESTGVACSDYVSHNRLQMLRIPLLLLVCSQEWTCNLQMIVSLEPLGANAFNFFVEITMAIKMKTIVRKRLMIKIIKLRLRYLDNQLEEVFCIVLNQTICLSAL